MTPIKFQPTLLLASLTRPRSDEAQAEKKSAPKNIGLDFFKQMQNQKTEMVSSRKQAAQAHIAQLKAQIENALRFAHIGSGNPRMVAQLAKELKSLVAQYGGSASGVGNMGTPTLSAENTEQATASSSDSAEQGATASVDAAQIAEAAQVATEATAASSANHAAQQDQATKAGQTDDKADDKTNASPLNTSRQGDAGDQAFFALAKELTQKLKLLLAIESQKIKTKRIRKTPNRRKKKLNPSAKRLKKPKSASPTNTPKSPQWMPAPATMPVLASVAAWQAASQRLSNH